MNSLRNGVHGSPGFAPLCYANPVMTESEKEKEFAFSATCVDGAPLICPKAVVLVSGIVLAELILEPFLRLFSKLD